MLAKLLEHKVHMNRRAVNQMGTAATNKYSSIVLAAVR